jgi:hypothetical protein
VPKTGRDGSAGRSSVSSTAALEVGGGADKPDMAEGLGEVAEQLATGRVDLLGQLPQVVGLAQQPLEQCGGPVGLASEGEVVDQPQAGVYPPQAQAFPIGQAKNLTVKMSNCNHRRYLPELVTMTRSGAVDPSKVLTQVDDVLDVIEAYEAFDRREPTWIKAAALDPRA